jgi:hypothetical protein
MNRCGARVLPSPGFRVSVGEGEVHGAVGNPFPSAPICAQPGRRAANNPLFAPTV